MSTDRSKNNTFIIVRNMPEDMEEEELKDLFAKYGPLTSCEIMLSKNLDVGRFAYVAFADPDAAEKAITEVNCQEIVYGRRIHLLRTQRKVKENSVPVNHENVNRCENLSTICSGRSMSVI